MGDERLTIKAKFNDNNSEVELFFGPPDAEPWGSRKFNSIEFSGLLQTLLVVRSRMQGLPPEQKPPEGSEVSAADPYWWFEPDNFGGGAILSIQDPRIGWLNYMLAPPSCRDLHRLLQERIPVMEAAEKARQNKPN